MILRNPKFGNTISLDTGVTVRTTLDGSTILNRNREDLVLLTFAFDSMTVDQRNSLMDFLINVVGEEIIITDHENQTWRGLFTDTEPVFRTDSRICSYSTSLNFQGVRV